MKPHNTVQGYDSFEGFFRSATHYTPETYSWPIERDKLVAKILMEGFITERSFNDMPSKACENNSLKQLSNILNTQTDKNSLQTRLNLHLLQELKSLNIVRYYTYSHRYSTLDVSSFWNWFEEVHAWFN